MAILIIGFMFLISLNQTQFLFIFFSNIQIKVTAGNNEITIVDNEVQFLQRIDQQIKQLQDESFISLWPDQTGRLIINYLVDNYTKNINIVLQGDYSGLNQQVLNNFTRNSQNIKITTYASFLKQNKTIDIAFLTPRSTALDCGLLVKNKTELPFTIKDLNNELATNFGYENAGGPGRTDIESSSGSNYNQDIQSYFIRSVEINEFINKTNQFYILFKGDLMKEATKLILEENKGTTSWILYQLKQCNKKYEILIDTLSAQLLKPIQQPWTQQNFQWQNKAAKDCLCQVSAKLNKKIQDLQQQDLLSVDAHMTNQQLECYKEYVIQDLKSRVKHINTGIFEGLKNLPKDQKINICFFSPHPDDDAISAGGVQHALIKQVLEQKYNNIALHVCYCVTGAVAVSDQSLITFMNRFGTNYNKNIDDNIVLTGHGYYDQTNYITQYTCSEQDFRKHFSSGVSPKSKAMLRELEAMGALDTLDFFNYENNTANFLRLPFYGSGFGQRRSPGQEDVDGVLEIMKKYQPDIIILAGDLSDPHGTHGFCYQIIKDACQIYEDKYRIVKPVQNKQYNSVFSLNYIDTSIEEIEDLIFNQHIILKFLYRGAWSEFVPNEATMMMVMNKIEMNRKMTSINQHTSQMGQALYLANDPRPFDVRAIQRNEFTAEFLKVLGVLEHNKPAFAECLVACQELP